MRVRFCVLGFRIKFLEVFNYSVDSYFVIMRVRVRMHTATS